VASSTILDSELGLALTTYFLPSLPYYNYTISSALDATNTFNVSLVSWSTRSRNRSPEEEEDV